jgi:predicted  nucleic acid-binding Zn-ribbon protein
MDKKKIKKLLAVLKPDATQVDFADFDKKVKELQDSLKEKIQAQTLDDVRGQLDKFQKKIDFAPLSDSVQSIEESLNTKLEAISQAIDEELATLKGLIDSKDSEAKGGITQVNENIKLLEAEYKGLDLRKTTDIAELKDRISQLSSIADTATQAISGLKDVLEESRGDVNVIRDDLQAITSSNINSLEKLRQELSNRINNLRIGGGNQNRNIAIGGNTSVLSKYTDINIKPGSNVTLTYSNNDTTKYLDLTITATGGSSVAGTTRSINREATSQTMGGTASTDYVYIATDGILLTLPTAVGNSNLYTVKNVAASSVMVATTGGQTIDGDSNIILNNQYTSVDIVNDGNDNWSIT